MSRDERYGTRSLVYSKWHRLFLGDHEPMIDLDAVEYCPERGCNKPLVLIETARDQGQASKPTTVLAKLAEASATLALCVLYRISPGVDPMAGCACIDSRNIAPDCDHGISRFRVQRVYPRPVTRFRLWTPEQYRDRLRRVRMDHLDAEHHTWEVA